MNTYLLIARDGRRFIVEAFCSTVAMRKVENRYDCYISAWYVYDGYAINDPIMVN